MAPGGKLAWIGGVVAPDGGLGWTVAEGDAGEPVAGVWPVGKGGKLKLSAFGPNVGMVTASSSDMTDFAAVKLIGAGVSF